MNKWLKIFIGLVLVGITAAGLGYKFIYNKPHKDYAKARADFSLTSQELFAEYQNDRQTAEQKFNGKVVEISGLLNNVEAPESMTIAVFAIQKGMFGDEGIRCTMLPDFAENIIPMAGKKVIIKGYCTGYNDTDIILEKCSVIK